MVDFSFQEMVLLENDGLRDFGTDSDEIKYEYFMNRNLSDVLTGLTCHQLERVNLLDILMVLSRYNRLMARDPWAVYPQAMRNCFGRKIAQFGALLSQMSNEGEAEDLKKLGWHSNGFIALSRSLYLLTASLFASFK